MPEPKVNRYVQVPYELYQRLQEVAAREGLSVNAAIVAAIEAWVASHEGRRAKGGASK